MYISHMRSEGNRVNEALNELITIAREANIHAEIYHMKVAGKANWPKLDSMIRQVEDARKQGLNITANMRLLTLPEREMTPAFPPSLQDGGFDKLRKRLGIPQNTRRDGQSNDSKPQRLGKPLLRTGPAGQWGRLLSHEIFPKKLNWQTLAEVAKIRHKSPEETAMDLIVQDSTRVGVAYFLMNEANVKKQIALPWISFCSDEGSYTDLGVSVKSERPPRLYGNFSGVGKSSRDEKVITLQDAVRVTNAQNQF